MERYFYLSALLIITSVSLLAIYSHKFDDSLGQRVGLSLMGFGSAIRFWTYLDGYDLDGPRFLLTYGIAIYGVCTACKLWRKQRLLPKQKDAS